MSMLPFEDPMPSPNPYEPPQDAPPSSAPKQPPGGLWPDNRRRRDRMVGGTLQAWLLLGLRTLIFVVVIAALLILMRQARQ
jgi:hypothetical protein